LLKATLSQVLRLAIEKSLLRRRRKKKGTNNNSKPQQKLKQKLQ
jgi:hypothetical protein